MNKSPILATLLIAMLAGCASPKTAVPVVSDAEVEEEQFEQIKFAVEREMDGKKRLFTAASRVSMANSELCGDQVAPNIGANFVGVDSELSKIYTRATLEVLGAPDGATGGRYIHMLLEDGPAARAGLQAGDRLVSFNGVAIPADTKIDESPKFEIKSSGNVIEVERDGETKRFEVDAESACDYPTLYKDDSVVNAYADGESIIVTRGMVKFTESEEELALVHAHELAHNTQAHLDAKRANAIIGMAGGFVLDVALGVVGVNTGGALTRAGGNVGAGTFSQSFEREADYVGLYYMARAGYDTSDAANFWRRMGVENNSSAILAARTHPTTAERYVILARANEEIGFKRGNGEPLVPNYKETTEETTTVLEEPENGQ